MFDPHGYYRDRPEVSRRGQVIRKKPINRNDKGLLTKDKLVKYIPVMQKNGLLPFTSNIMHITRSLPLESTLGILFPLEPGEQPGIYSGALLSERMSQLVEDIDAFTPVIITFDNFEQSGHSEFVFNISGSDQSADVTYTIPALQATRFQIIRNRTDDYWTCVLFLSNVLQLGNPATISNICSSSPPVSPDTSVGISTALSNAHSVNITYYQMQ